MRRTVTVRLVPSGGGDGAPIATPAPTGEAQIIELAPSTAELPSAGEFRLSVQVDKERYSAPERQAGDYRSRGDGDL
jgi:hypothetical protein